MREFADQQVERFFQHWLQIVRFAQVRAVPDAQAAVLKQKTEGAEIHRVFFSKLGAEAVEVRGGKGSDPNAVFHV